MQHIIFHQPNLYHSLEEDHQRKLLNLYYEQHYDIQKHQKHGPEGLTNLHAHLPQSINNLLQFLFLHLNIQLQDGY